MPTRCFDRHSKIAGSTSNLCGLFLAETIHAFLLDGLWLLAPFSGTTNHNMRGIMLIVRVLHTMDTKSDRLRRHDNVTWTGTSISMGLCACFATIVSLTYCTAETTPNTLDERSHGSRVERIGFTGVYVNLTWWRTSVPSWLQASRKCADIGAQLPKVNEMRYFYKTLRSEDTNISNVSSNRVVFYLADILEATMDYPNTESGERMCLVVEKKPNSPVRLAETEAIRSCLTNVNLVVCRSFLQTDSRVIAQDPSDDAAAHPCGPYGDQWIGAEPQWIIDLKRKAEGSRDLLCFKPITWYLCVAGVAVVLFTATVISLSLAWKIRRRHRQFRDRYGRQLSEEHFSGTPDSRAASDILLAKRSNVQSPAAGHMDILADSAFYRPAPNRSDCTTDLPRDSYKQMLINDAYQKMSNGALSTSQRGSKMGQSNLSSFRGAAGSSRRMH